MQSDPQPLQPPRIPRQVVVTGGSRGLGLAIAVRLAEGGDRVIVVARSGSAALTDANAALSAAGHPPIALRTCDLADTQALPAFVRQLRRELGPIDALINNAGIGTSGVLGIMRDQDIERLVRLNTLSPMILTKYVVRAMMAQRSGRVVNIASVVALTGYSGLSVYSATKASLIGFTRSLAREVGEFGITVNAIAPGFAATEMTESLDLAQRERVARRSALRRLIDPSDVAAAVHYLLSDAARNVTGTVLTVDAGNTA